MIPPDEVSWFTQNLQPHEAAVRMYLASRFPWLREQDDVVQESYMRIWRARRERQIEHVRAFFFSTAHNVAVDLVRRRSKLNLVEFSDDDATVLQQAAHAGDVLDKVVRESALADALDDLPQRCREVVRLRFEEGLSYKEIAAKLGVTTDTVKMQLGRGVRRCAKALEMRKLLRCASEEHRA